MRLVVLMICTVLTAVVAVPLAYREGIAVGRAAALLSIAVLVTALWRLSGRKPSWSIPVAAALVFVVVLAWAITFYQDIGKQARLPADRGTIAALRSASAIYYGKNGVFPTQATLQTLIQGFQLVCPGRDVECRHHQRQDHVHAEHPRRLLTASRSEKARRCSA